MCSGKERKTALSIFRSIKIWFPLHMKTRCLYYVAAAWGHVQKSHTERHQQLGLAEKQGAISGQGSIDLERGGRLTEGEKAEMQHLTRRMKQQEILSSLTTQKKTLLAHSVLNSVPRDVYLRLSETKRFNSLCQFLHQHVFVYSYCSSVESAEE